MRTRKEIKDDYSNAKENNNEDRIFLEILLDVRDLLTNKN